MNHNEIKAATLGEIIFLIGSRGIATDSQLVDAINKAILQGKERELNTLPEGVTQQMVDDAAGPFPIA